MCILSAVIAGALVMRRRGSFARVGVHPVAVRRVRAAFVMAERHALPRRHGRHALYRHDESQHDGEEAHELKTHARIVAQAFGAASVQEG